MARKGAELSPGEAACVESRGRPGGTVAHLPAPPPDQVELGAGWLSWGRAESSLAGTGPGRAGQNIPEKQVGHMDSCVPW